MTGTVFILHGVFLFFMLIPGIDCVIHVQPNLRVRFSATTGAFQQENTSVIADSSALATDLNIGQYTTCRQQEIDGGRQWYTALEHKSECYSKSDFRQHLLGGIAWAVRQ